MSSRFCSAVINAKPELYNRQLFPKIIRDKAKEKSILLEDLLGLGAAANVQIHTFGYDNFSGARKLFISKKYKIKDITMGAFDISELGVKQREKNIDEIDV